MTEKKTPSQSKDWNFDADMVREMADVMVEKNLSEIEFAQGDCRLRVSRGGLEVSAAVLPQAYPDKPAQDLASPKAQGTDLSSAVCSPMVGILYMSPDPQSPAFVSVGEEVSEGQTLCLVEAMKVFNPILAPRAGTVKKILGQTGTLVEFDQLLFIIE